MRKTDEQKAALAPSCGPPHYPPEHPPPLLRKFKPALGFRVPTAREVRNHARAARVQLDAADRMTNKTVHAKDVYRDRCVDEGAGERSEFFDTTEQSSWLVGALHCIPALSYLTCSIPSLILQLTVQHSHWQDTDSCYSTPSEPPMLDIQYSGYSKEGS